MRENLTKGLSDIEGAEESRVKRIRIIVTVAISVVAVLLIAVILAFGPVGRYAFADRFCETNASAAADALKTVPDSYRDTAKLRQYLVAIEAYENEDYDTAESIFLELDYYRNSRILIKDVYYGKAVTLREKGQFDEAMLYFEKCNNEKGNNEICATKYILAEGLYEKGKFSDAAEAFKEIEEFSDAADRYLESLVSQAEALSQNGELEQAATLAYEALIYKEQNRLASRAATVIFDYAVQLMDNGEWQSAVEQLERCKDYPIEGVVEEKTEFCASMLVYDDAVALMEAEQYAEAVALFDTIKGFLDADQLNLICEQKAYAWTFTGYLSKDGTEAKKTKTFVRADTIYFYGTLSGGKPNKTVTLLFVWVDCADRSVTCRVEDWVDGSSGGVTFAYSDPKNANFGKSTITVYVEETGQQLAKYNFTINK